MSPAERAPAPEPSREPAPSFDDRLRRLEAIVAELEAGGAGLEVAIERYQEGIALLKDCHVSLAGYRRRVEELTRDAEEAMRPFAPDPDAEEG
ncbi:MAG: exodeoxyribonuclease VII small subunit [Planctomycetota bacterium]